MIHENWAYVAAAINVLGTISYVVAVFQGKARPNRVTWGVLTIAPMIAFASMLSQGVSVAQSIVTFSFGFSPFMIFVSSYLVKHPAWQIKRFDIVCGALSLLGLLLWWFTGEGNVAIVFSIVADALAFLPTLVKAYYHPETESPWTFMASELATIMGLMTVTMWNFEHVAFQVYILCANIVAIVFIYFRFGVWLEKRRKHKTL
ncbi:hypothetical protein IPL68_05010 [Candidatus Saccharibacteria bacterium]|nr:MAG: hypothetical protein IPL68_05010 [Candidatus Saccharibacteria bacterium]